MHKWDYLNAGICPVCKIRPLITRNHCRECADEINRKMKMRRDNPGMFFASPGKPYSLKKVEREIELAEMYVELAMR